MNRSRRGERPSFGCWRARFDAMVQGVRTVVTLPDPIGKRLSKKVRPNGLVIEKRRVPLGVIAIIYESRPNVTADAAVLCPSFYKAEIVQNPTWWDRLKWRLRSIVIGAMAC